MSKRQVKGVLRIEQTPAKMSVGSFAPPRRETRADRAESVANIGGLLNSEETLRPDAQLIEACNEFLRIERAYEAACQALGDKDIEPDDPANAMLAPVEALTEKIVALRAVTADGFLARARCAAFFYRPEHSACQDDPEEGCDSRFMAAILRDAVRLNGETDQ
jgi:hypothetical protein